MSLQMVHSLQACEIMNTVYIFNIHFNGLGVIRALKDSDVTLTGLDSMKYPVGRFSKYLHKFHRVPDPVLSAEKFIESLIAIIEKDKSRKKILIPTNDEWVIAVSKYKDIIDKLALSYVPDISKLESIINKQKFYCLMEEENILIPKSYNLDFIIDNNMLHSLPYPVIFKPNSRRNINKSGEILRCHEKYRLMEIDNYHEAYKYGTLLYKKDFLVQQNIIGNTDHMYTVGIYADKNSKVRAVFSGRKVRGYPVRYGDCFAGESLWIPELVEKAQIIAGKLHYTGIAEIEFKKNDRDNHYYCIEMNPRTWSWVGITPAAGVNLPLIAYKDLIGEPIPEMSIMNKEKKVMWTRSIEDKRNASTLRKQGLKKPFGMTQKEWTLSLKNYDDIVSADLDNDDKIPGYFWVINLFINKLKKIIKRRIRRE
jgi:D-aspartate ligase